MKHLTHKLLITLIFGLGFVVKAQNVGIITGGTDYLWAKLNYSLMNDTTIKVIIQRTISTSEQLTVNFELDELSLNSKIASAKSDLNPNIFKFAKAIPAQYVEFPSNAVIQPGQVRTDVTIRVKKNILLRGWEGEFETYVLPFAIKPSSNYTITSNKKNYYIAVTRQTAPGITIKHFPASSGTYIGSPSICILPNGDYVASYDLNTTTSAINNNVTEIYRSTDKGETWSYASTITGQFWSTLFVNNGCLYIIGPDKVAGNMVIRLSTDDGYTWTTPTNKMNGIIQTGRYHTAPTSVVFFNGRIWRATEDAELSAQNEPDRVLYKPMVMSAPIYSDILNGYNWVASNSIPFDSNYLNGSFGGFLEGGMVSDGVNLYNLLRTNLPLGMPEYSAIMDVSHSGRNLQFDSESGFQRMIGSSKKFTVRYDPETRKYYTIVNFDYEGYTDLKMVFIRNSLILMSSTDLKNWKINKILLRHSDVKKVGFQYVDWQFDGNNIIYVSRTAYPDNYGGAMNFHNANFMTFHRINDFRQFQEINLERNAI